MSSARPRPLTVLRTAVAATFGLALLLSGCGAGQRTQTAEQVAAVNGASGQAGEVVVRNAMLTFPTGGEHFYPAGSDAPLVLTIVNTGDAEDELTSVTSAAAEEATVDGQRRLLAQGTLRAITEDEGASPTAAGLGQGEIRITLENLTQDVRPGRTVPVTLLFRQAGEVRIEVPIGPTDAERPEAETEH